MGSEMAVVDTGQYDKSTPPTVALLRPLRQKFPAAEQTRDVGPRAVGL